MRKVLVVVGVVAVAALVILIARSRWPEPSTEVSQLQIIRARPTEVTVAWRTPKSTLGRVAYQRGGEQTEPTTARETPPPSKKHELTLSGLEPGARYRYWVAGTQTRYHFETPPLPTTPFSFLLVWGDPSERIEALVQSEVPGFVLSLTPVPSADRDPFQAVRPYLPVFGPDGVSSTVLEQRSAATWALTWGGVHLVVAAEPVSTLPELPAAAAPHTIGVVIAGRDSDPAALSTSELHDAIEAHNERSPSRPVAFVLVSSTSDEQVKAGEVVYLGVPVTEGRAGAVRLDVGPESIVARFVDSGTEVTLRKSELKRRRTCKECRQLADRGAYEQSVKAYQEFIETHEGHFQIDDAHYAIAEILDERLFRHAQALTWYRKLVDGYPDSTLVPLAQQRIKFLTAHGDHDFVPLARFERIRKVEFARQKNDPAKLAGVLQQVEQLIAAYPDATLAPEMSYWLANQYRQLDADRAVATYRSLLRAYPDYAGRDDVHIEIGETYYQARRYGDAIEAFRQARTAVPSRAQTIDAQIGRALRNQTRGHLAWAGWIVLALLVAPGAMGRPRALAGRDARRAIVAFLVLALLLLLAGWLNHEQFTSPAELLGLALGLAASGAWGFPFAAAAARRAWRIRPSERRKGRLALLGLSSLVFGLLFLFSGAYLSIYYLNEHYLNSFGL